MADGPFDSEPEKTSPADSDILPLQDPGANSDHHVTWETIRKAGGTTFMRRQINDLFVAMARSQFEDNLDELAYDGGFFDIFRDESKIASKTNVAVATLDGGDADGTVVLGRGDASLPDYQDSNTSQTSSKGVVINPNESLTGVTVVLGSTQSGITRVGVWDTNGNLLGSTTDLSTPIQVTGLTLNSGTKYYVAADAQGSNYTEAFRGSGSTSYPYAGNALDITGGVFDATSSGNENTAAYNIKSVGSDTYDTPGSITSITFDLGFVPSSVVLSQDADIPTDEDIQFVIRDTAGTPNEVTVTQAEIDTEVDVSALTTQTVEIEPTLSSSDGADTPTLREFASYFT